MEKVFLGNTSFSESGSSVSQTGGYNYGDYTNYAEIPTDSVKLDDDFYKAVTEVPDADEDTPKGNGNVDVNKDDNADDKGDSNEVKIPTPLLLLGAAAVYYFFFYKKKK